MLFNQDVKIGKLFTNTRTVVLNLVMAVDPRSGLRPAVDTPFKIYRTQIMLRFL